jgi:hypothetical protein
MIGTYCGKDVTQLVVTARQKPMDSPTVHVGVVARSLGTHVTDTLGLACARSVALI